MVSFSCDKPVRCGAPASWARVGDERRKRAAGQFGSVLGGGRAARATKGCAKLARQAPLVALDMRARARALSLARSLAGRWLHFRAALSPLSSRRAAFSSGLPSNSSTSTSTSGCCRRHRRRLEMPFDWINLAMATNRRSPMAGARTHARLLARTHARTRPANAPAADQQAAPGDSLELAENPSNCGRV